MKITGTFLDEITHDIPSNNWGPAEWAADFDAMKAIGIDTVIIIRAGYADRVTFPSRTLRSHVPNVRECYRDYVDLFLREAERCGMDFYFGTYDGKHWLEGDTRRELEINKEFCTEAVERYGDRKAFSGWYLSHELSGYDPAQIELYRELGTHLKKELPLPVLMSPYVHGRMQFDDPVEIEAHRDQWDTIFREISGFVDTVAFQDGQMHFSELPAFMEANCELARKHGITPWSNIESFERGMPIDFLPINWDNMHYKLSITEQYPIEKLITFEFSHFMSPNSMYPSARHLYNRYREYVGGFDESVRRSVP